jgi:hypothetical protein
VKTRLELLRELRQKLEEAREINRELGGGLAIINSDIDRVSLALYREIEKEAEGAHAETVGA